MNFIVFQVPGGIGKNVIATAVIRSLNFKYPEHKIIILTAHPDIWVNNPRVHRIIQFGQTAYFYEDFIKDKETLIFAHDPYACPEAIYRKKHLSQIWCELCGVEFSGEEPELYFTVLEREQVNALINKNSPILIIQPFGGAQTNNKYSWMRDIPPVLAQTIVDEFRKEYRIIQIKREDQIGLNGVEYLSQNPRILALSLLLSDKRILIDSYIQHAAAALGLPSHVFWIGNSPTVFGYQMHKNITTNFEIGSTRNSLYEPFDITGDPIQLSTHPNNLFDAKLVIDFIKGNVQESPVEASIVYSSQSSGAPSIKVPEITDLFPNAQNLELVPLEETESKEPKSKQKSSKK
jgi:hypothetical protein